MSDRLSRAIGGITAFLRNVLYLIITVILIGVAIWFMDWVLIHAMENDDYAP